MGWDFVDPIEALPERRPQCHQKAMYDRNDVLSLSSVQLIKGISQWIACANSLSDHEGSSGF